MSEAGRVRLALTTCPVCGKDLEIHPVSGDLACFLCGDFKITEDTTGTVTITFVITQWALNNHTDN